MAKISNLMVSIQEEIELGQLSSIEIADKFEVPVDWVIEAAKMSNEYADD